MYSTIYWPNECTYRRNKNLVNWKTLIAKNKMTLYIAFGSISPWTVVVIKPWIKKSFVLIEYNALNVLLRKSLIQIRICETEKLSEKSHLGSKMEVRTMMVAIIKQNMSDILTYWHIIEYIILIIIMKRI